MTNTSQEVSCLKDQGVQDMSKRFSSFYDIIDSKREKEKRDFEVEFN